MQLNAPELLCSSLKNVSSIDGEAIAISAVSTINGIHFPDTSGSLFTQGLPGFVIVKDEGTTEIGTRLDFHNVGSSRDYDFRLYGSGHDLKLQTPDGNTETINYTVTHNAPLSNPLSSFEVGKPVYSSGAVFHLNRESCMYESGTVDSINCIPSVKSTGTYKTYLGICTAIHPAGSKIEVGDVIKSDAQLVQDTIDFATHGDFIFKVADSSRYRLGDTVLFDGSVIDDEALLNRRIQKSIVGDVTAIIDSTTISVFKT